MLRSSLKGLVADSVDVLAKAGIDPKLRAEQLGIADFCRLAIAVQEAEAK
jgi:16S rRNA (adenine1518-N6/adenine1519-N6)-dimethyltransferase